MYIIGSTFLRLKLGLHYRALLPVMEPGSLVNLVTIPQEIRREQSEQKSDKKKPWVPREDSGL
jgi:hypothetical protein